MFVMIVNQLTRLDLRDNDLVLITDSLFVDMISLKYLRLDDNNITSVHDKALLSLAQLSYMVLKGNPLGTSFTR